jgi:hypothetical protein
MSKQLTPFPAKNRCKELLRHASRGLRMTSRQVIIEKSLFQRQPGASLHEKITDIRDDAFLQHRLRISHAPGMCRRSR